MAISWTKLFSSSDDGAALTGAQLRQMQDDISSGTAASLPTQGSSDVLKFVRVKSDYSGYELVTADHTVPTIVAFVSSSGSATQYCVSPVTGNVVAAYVVKDSVGSAGAYTITNTSSGGTIASGTVASAGAAGAVTSLSLTSVALVAGAAITVARGISGTPGTATVTLVITKTI